MFELNLPARESSQQREKYFRRAKMREWRKCPVLFFDNEENLNQWLTYLNWKKRPIEKIKCGPSLMVKFMDHKDNKPKAVA